MIGTDFEAFITDQENRVVPADNIFPSEEDSIKLGNGNEVFYDGMQAEVKVGPSHCRGYVCDNLVQVFRRLNKDAEDKNLKLLLEPAVEINQQVMEAAVDPKSRMFGCEPHLAVELGGLPEIIDVDAARHMRRYAGGHIHLGVINPDSCFHSDLNETLLSAEGRLRTVKMLDIIVGNTLVMIERDQDRMRRELYGKAGTYREKPYGLEYRTPGNLWGRHPGLANLVMSLCRDAVNIVRCNLDAEFELPRDMVVEAINTVNKDLARANFSMIKEKLYEIQSGMGTLQDFSGNGMAAFEFLSMVGVDEIVPPSLFTEAWALDNQDRCHHGSLTPTWNSAYPRLFEKYRSDWESFKNKWSVKEVYA
jgi:hypothetical protein